MQKIKVSEIIKKYQGKVFYKRVLTKEGILTGKMNRTGIALLKDMEEKEVVNDINLNCPLGAYFGFMYNGEGKLIC